MVGEGDREPEDVGLVGGEAEKIIGSLVVQKSSSISPFKLLALLFPDGDLGDSGWEKMLDRSDFAAELGVDEVSTRVASFDGVSCASWLKYMCDRLALGTVFGFDAALTGVVSFDGVTGDPWLK